MQYPQGPVHLGPRKAPFGPTQYDNNNKQERTP